MSTQGTIQRTFKSTLRFLGLNKDNGNSGHQAGEPGTGPDVAPTTSHSPLPDSPDPIYNELLDIYKAYIQLEHDAGWDAARRDLLNAQSLAHKAYSLRDVLGELIGLLFVDLRKGVKRFGWTPKNISRLQHLHDRCEELPIDREVEQVLDLLDEYRAHAVPNEKKL